MASNPGMEFWKKAISQYLSGAGQETEEYFEECKEILELIASEEWQLFLRLLDVSNREVPIGFAAGGLGEIGYFLGKNGFFWRQKREGKMHEEYFSSGSEDVHHLAVAFRNMYPSSVRGSFKGVVIGELRKIAEASPRPTSTRNFVES